MNEEIEEHNDYWFDLWREENPEEYWKMQNPGAIDEQD